MTTLYTLQMVGVFEAEEPIIHTAESIGNIAKIKRMKVLDGGKPASVPALSGNSFRGQLRDLMADRFIEMVRGEGEKVNMTADTYGVMFSGGVMREGSDLSSKLESYMTQIPLVRVMGSAFGTVMLPSKIAVSHLIPLTKETRQSLNDRLAVLTGGNHPLLAQLQRWLASLPEAEEISFEEGPLTRKDDSKNPLLTEDVILTDKPAPGEKGPQMIYHVECIASGVLLLHRMATKFPLDQPELGCLFDGLAAFAQNPIVGGRGSAGYGRVNFLYHVTLTPSTGAPESLWLDAASLVKIAEGEGTVAQAIKVYRSQVTKNAPEIRNTLKA
jgi:hypothetical protein